MNQWLGRLAALCARTEPANSVAVRRWGDTKLAFIAGRVVVQQTPLPRTVPASLFHMYQVTFSDQSMRELNRLDKLAQLEAIEPISKIRPSDLANPREPLGKFTRGNQTFYRLRAGEFRFYFDVKDETLHTHYILHKSSLEDLLFRMKLPVSEQQLFEQDSKFWKYLESLTK
jgi:mRNA-degrading endonuclease RelE of RelBE toxin-antitoxin system